MYYDMFAIPLKYAADLNQMRATAYQPVPSAGLDSTNQSYEIKSPPWTILWFRILGIFSVENIKRLWVFMFQT